MNPEPVFESPPFLYFHTDTLLAPDEDSQHSGAAFSPQSRNVIDFGKVGKTVTDLNFPDQ